VVLDRVRRLGRAAEPAAAVVGAQHRTRDQAVDHGPADQARGDVAGGEDPLRVHREAVVADRRLARIHEVRHHRHAVDHAARRLERLPLHAGRVRDHPAAVDDRHLGVDRPPGRRDARAGDHAHRPH
ncbi:MAG: hypothetical protein ACK55I_01190, partial [bacterium]